MGVRGGRLAASAALITAASPSPPPLPPALPLDTLPLLLSPLPLPPLSVLRCLEVEISADTVGDTG